MLKFSLLPHRENTARIFLLFLLVVTLVYSNTFTASWHLDDMPNIVNNANIHIRSLTPSEIFRSFHSPFSSSQRISRPVSYLTLAINWYFCKDSVFGYHVVNILIHAIVLFLLFRVITVLYASPRLRSYREREPTWYPAALTAALLWAVNPIQTQAVNYIVQRMASLAALFYLWGILNYLYARTTEHVLKRYGYLFLMLCCFFASVGSKENGIMFPAAIVLIEGIFFSKRVRAYQRLFFVLAISGGLFYLLLLWSNQNPLPSFLDYSARSFTLQERLLTEPRIIVYYLSLIFYPLPSRLSLLHDINISSSLFHPLTTLWAFIFLWLLTIFSIWNLRKTPILSFAILFYLLNHLVESTILPLELVFEHRNYLPSLFLFWPLTAVVLETVRRYWEKQRFIGVLLLVTLFFYMFSLGIWTYIRNRVWHNEETLWSDVLKKNPNLARPYQGLAIFLSSRGRTDLAISLYEKSLRKKDQTPGRSQNLAYQNIGSYFLKQGNLDKAQKNFAAALNALPGDVDSYYSLILTLIREKKYQEAARLTDRVLAEKQNQKSARFLNTRGFIFLKTGQPKKALAYLRAAYFANPGDRKIMLNLAAAMIGVGDYPQARDLLVRVSKLYGDDLLTLLLQAETELLLKNTAAADVFLSKIFLHFPLPVIKAGLHEQPDRLTLDTHLLLPALENKSRELIKSTTSLLDATQ